MVTGAPGVGKTTLIERIHHHYKDMGLSIAGITTREVRERDRRVGFRITDLSSGTEGWLARIGEGPGPRIQKYTVDSEDLEKVGVNAIRKSAGRINDMVLVDEIGPMEMTSNNFRKAIDDLLSSDQIIVATLKQGSHYPELEKAKNAHMVRIEILRENRDQAFQEITFVVDKWTKPRN